MGSRDSREAGFTIVEVVVAALVLVMGTLATFGLLSAATKNTQRAKASQVALNRAQEEIEALRSLSNEQLAMTATAPPSSDPLNPGYRVSGGQFALTREPPGNDATMVVNEHPLYGGGSIEGGIVNPGPVPFTSGDVSGKIYRYVVWQNDDSCGDECPGEQDYKRIVVAVKLDTRANEAGERGYVEVQSDFVDPVDSSANDPKPGPEGVVTAQQFFLSDTPCDADGSTERAEITGSHLLHNTLGVCADGLQSGGTPGAPDALLLGGPPDPAPEDINDPAFYDYASDYYLDPNPDTDKGLQIRPDDTNGCHYEPVGTTTPESQIHRWVTDPMAAEFKLSGSVTIEFYTRTLNDAEHKGTLCVYLYDRSEEEPEGAEEGAPPVATDTLLTNTAGNTAYWTYTPQGNANWPRTAWTKVRLTMTFNNPPYKILAGHRLGVALSLELANTPADAIPFLYDHPNFPSRIEVDTTTPLDGG
jgi:type II secretory pathway pseudopilin PulG